MFRTRRRARLTGWPALALLLGGLIAAGYLCSRSFSSATPSPPPSVAPVVAITPIPNEARVKLSCGESYCNGDNPLIIRAYFGARSPVLKQYPQGTEAIILEHRPSLANENPNIMYYRIKIETLEGWIDDYSVKIDILR